MPRTRFGQPFAQSADVEGERMPPLVHEASKRLAPLREILGRRYRRCRSSTGAPASVRKGRVDHGAPIPRRPYGEGQITIVAVKEAVVLVETAHLVKQRARDEQTHAVHGRHLDHGSAQGGALGQAVHDAASGVVAVPAQAPGPVKTRQAHAVSRGQGTVQFGEP
jgi:hypothetical protein